MNKNNHFVCVTFFYYYIEEAKFYLYHLRFSAGTLKQNDRLIKGKQFVNVCSTHHIGET